MYVVSYLRAFLLVFIAYHAAASAVLADQNELEERGYYYGPTKTVTIYRTNWATKRFTITKCTTKTIVRISSKCSKTIIKTSTKYLKTSTKTIIKTSIKTSTKTCTKTVTTTAPPKTSTKTCTKTVTDTLPASTITLPASTITLPGSSTTITITPDPVTIDTTITLPGEGTITTTITLPGEDGLTTTVTIPTTITLPGEDGTITTVTIPTTITLPGEDGTTTVTVSTTVTTTLYPSPDLSCGNQGLAYAVYDSPFENTDVEYTNFPVEYFKTQTPRFTNTTTKVGITMDGSIYGVPVDGLDYTAINHRGYLFARESGNYTFTAPSTDDITLFWIGPDAFSGYTRANAQIVQPYTNNAAAVRSYTASLVAGEYYPIRILWGNGQNGALFRFSVTGPNGDVILDSDTEASPYLVTASCDRISAPQFPNFGEET